MKMAIFDTPKLAHRLRDSESPDGQARAIAEAFKNASGDAELATKADIVRLEYKLETGTAMLEQRMTIKLGGLIVAATGLILAALRYLPARH